MIPNWCDGFQNAPPIALKPLTKKVLKPIPRPEQAAKTINTGSDENRGPPEAAAADKLPRKKVVDTITSVLSHRSKVSSATRSIQRDTSVM